MLIMQNMKERIDAICNSLAAAKGAEYADACKAFLTKLDEQGKIVGKSIVPTMQAFWTNAALDCVGLLIASPEYEYDADAQSFLLDLMADIVKDLEQQKRTAKRKILY